MDIDTIVQTIAIIGAIFGGVVFIYKKGVTSGIDTACSKRIEEKIDTLSEDLGDHEAASGQEKKTLHKRIDETHDRITVMGADVAYIKGKLDSFLVD